jgi:hypothetical protein
MSVAIRQGQARAGIPFGVSHVMVIYPKTRYMRPVVRPFVWETADIIGSHQKRASGDLDHARWRLPANLTRGGLIWI